MSARKILGREVSWHAKLSLLAVALVIAGCSGLGNGLADLETRQELLTAKLPPLPRDDAGARNTSAEQMDTYLGFDIWDSTPGAMVEGDHLLLPATAENIEWSMYRFTVSAMDATLDNLSVVLSTTGNHGAWIAVSDYGNETWVLNGEFTANASVPLNSDYTSEMGYVYVLVIAFDGTTVDLTSVTLTYDDGTAPAVTYAGAGGTREFFAANCFTCHSAQAATAGVVLESYNGAAAVAATAKNKVANDHNGSYTADQKNLIAAWADGGAPLGDAVRYTTDMLPQVFSQACTDCHSSTLSGLDRNGAPSTVNWDTYAGASIGNQPNRGNTRAQAGTMPPASSGLSLSQAQKDLFQAWIDAGWPE